MRGWGGQTGKVTLRAPLPSYGGLLPPPFPLCFLPFLLYILNAACYFFLAILRVFQAQLPTTNRILRRCHQALN